MMRGEYGNSIVVAPKTTARDSPKSGGAKLVQLVLNDLAVSIAACACIVHPIFGLSFGLKFLLIIKTIVLDFSTSGFSAT
jgi:hypothetical protein